MKTRKDESLVIALGIGAVLGAVAIGVSVGTRTGPDAEVSSTASKAAQPVALRSPTTAAPSSKADATETPTLSAEVRSDLQTAGIQIFDPNNQDQPATSEAKAISVAQAEFPGMVTSPPSAASLMAVTIADHGKELQPDPNKPSQIQPTIERQAAWVVVFDSVDIPLMGAYNEDAPDTKPLTPAPSRFVVLIDANTGKFMHARTF